jgi:hypothetical protein
MQLEGALKDKKYNIDFGFLYPDDKYWEYDEEKLESIEGFNRTHVLRRCGMPPLLWISFYISYRFIRINRKKQMMSIHVFIWFVFINFGWMSCIWRKNQGNTATIS